MTGTRNNPISIHSTLGDVFSALSILPADEVRNRFANMKSDVSPADVNTLKQSLSDMFQKIVYFRQYQGLQGL
jgi:hypothetical protein